MYIADINYNVLHSYSIICLNSHEKKTVIDLLPEETFVPEDSNGYFYWLQNKKTILAGSTPMGSLTLYNGATLS